MNSNEFLKVAKLQIVEWYANKYFRVPVEQVQVISSASVTGHHRALLSANTILDGRLFMVDCHTDTMTIMMLHEEDRVVLSIPMYVEDAYPDLV